MPLKSLGIVRVETHFSSGAEIHGMGSFPGWLRAASGQVAELYLLLPITKRKSLGFGYRMRATDRLFAVGNCVGYLRAFMRFPEVAFRLVQMRGRTRVLICRAPEHLNALLLPTVRLLGFHIVIWLVHDRGEVLRAEMARRRSGKIWLGSLVSRATGLVERWALKRANGVIVNGSALETQIRDLGISPDRVLKVVSATIDKDVGQDERPGMNRAAPARLLYVGRIAPEKGLSDLLDAIANLANRGIDAQLSAIGWSGHGELERLEEQARRLSISSRVQFLGPVDHGEPLFAHYRNSDVFVLPSWVEGTPRVLIEAMAFGLPVVATKVGGVPDVIEHGVNGLLVPPKAPETLSDAISMVLSEPGLHTKISRTNVASAKEFRAERLAAKMLRFIESVAMA